LLFRRTKELAGKARAFSILNFAVRVPRGRGGGYWICPSVRHADTTLFCHLPHKKNIVNYCETQNATKEGIIIRILIPIILLPTTFIVLALTNGVLVVSINQ
jgi:hypothetical protein